MKETAKRIGRATARATRATTGKASNVAQGLVASDLATSINSMLAEAVKGAPTAYDKAMDAVYNATHIGDGKHRIFDGGHSVYGAAKASNVAAAELGHGIVDQAQGLTQALVRDATTTSGLPVVTWSQETYGKVAGGLERFGVSRKTFDDMITFDAAEAFGAMLASLALVFRWSKGDSLEFATILGSTSIAAAFSLNPLLACVSLAALAKSYQEARKDGATRAELAKSAIKGANATAVPMVAMNVVIAAGGPASVAVLASLLAGPTAATIAKNNGARGAGIALAGRLSRFKPPPASVMVAATYDAIKQTPTIIAGRSTGQTATGRRPWPLRGSIPKCPQPPTRFP